MNTKSILAFSAIAIAFALFVAPMAVSDVAADHSKYYIKKYTSQSNEANQAIVQSNTNEQTSNCNGSVNVFACNNSNTQTNTNSGSNVAVQSND